MKLAIGMRRYDGPWGGGNRFVASLTEAATRRGDTVVYDLEDPDIDIVLLVDPRVRSPNVSFGGRDISAYLRRNSRAIVIHRVNECDERKNTKTMNLRLVVANQVADTTVFVGEWLSRLPVWQKYLRDPWFTIRNGADEQVFNAEGFARWNGTGPLRLVTHHWGNNRLKGFDVYETVDHLLAQPKWRDRLAFTYVGRTPDGFTFTNARYVEPLNGSPLVNELRSHHAYITASINEPGGNHQNEGALCGLPLLYRNSGCLPEYCAGFGISFEGPHDLEASLEKLIEQYGTLAGRMPEYPHTASRMTLEWFELFDRLLQQRDQLMAQRRPWRHPLLRLANQLPL